MYLYVCLYTIYRGIQKLQRLLRITPLQVRGSQVSTSKRGAENLDAYRIALVKKKNKLVDVFHRSLTSDHISPPELHIR